MSRSKPAIPAPGSARSFWLQEALSSEPEETSESLRQDISADVCVVGGGFAGLWTAYRLIERHPGLRVVLLEQDICGGGASGRNGGFFSSSWWELQALVGLYGREAGARYAQQVADAVYEVGDWLTANDVDAWYHRDGVVGFQTNRWNHGVGSSDDIALFESLGLGDKMKPLTGDEVRGYFDTPRATAGVLYEDNAVVQPARLARGIRRVIIEKGVRVFEKTRVTAVDPGRPASVRAENAKVTAEKVVLTFGAWGADWKWFRRSFGVISDFVVATEPIPDLEERLGWRTFVGGADARELLFYLRRTRDDRIVIGGGSTSVSYGGKLGRTTTHNMRVAQEAANGLLWLFPQLEGVRFTHSWGGPIDMTRSFTPFYRTLAPGNIHAGLGYSGHGLSQTFVGGKILASLVLGQDDEWSASPLVGDEMAKTPPEPLRYPMVRAAVWGLDHTSRRVDAGKAPNLVARLIGQAPLAFRERLMRAESGANSDRES